MKKRFSIIFVLVVSLIFIISGCMNLNPASNSGVNDSPTSSNSPGYNSYIPTFIELQGREYNDNELVVGREYNSDELVVGYEERGAIDELLSKYKGATVEKEIPELKAVLIKLDTRLMDVKKAFEIIKDEKIDGIRYIEPNYTDRRLIPVIKGQDPQIQRNNSMQLNNNVTLETTDSFRKYQYALDLLKAETAWTSATGEGVIVGLLDTGTDGTHPDLEGQLVEGYDPYSGDIIDPDIDYDSDGHGTHTAGIIAAKKDDKGVTGLAPDAKIMPIRIFTPSSTGPIYVGDYAVADGIVWAVDHGADVLSNSWGGGGYSNVLKDAFDYALMNNVVVVASSGNDTTDQFWHYPSAFTGVIGVAASNARDEVTSFSSRGEYVSVAAPGDNVISSIPLEHALEEGVEGEPYAYWAGTSMACPYVSALAALLKQKYPYANVYQIKRMIEEGAEDIDALGYDTASGYGRINAANSLDLDPNEYEGGTLKVEAKAAKSEDLYLAGVNITLENKETGKRYYGKTNNKGYELFAWIEPGEYNIIIGGPDYLYAYAPNYRMQEELSYTGEVTVKPLSEGETIYTQEFETTQFKAEVEIDSDNDAVENPVTLCLMDDEIEIITEYELSSSEINEIDLLLEIQESGQYYLFYIYDGDDAFDLIVNITINNEDIPITIPISGEGGGFIDEYEGDGIPWTIF